MSKKKDEQRQDLLDAFNYCKAVHDEMLPEIKELRRAYDNIEAIDWFDVCEDEFDKKKLFKSGLMSQMTNLRASLMTSGRPRFFVNPIFREDVDVEKDFIEMAKAGYMTEAIVKDVAKYGNPKDWLNNVIDNMLDEWYQKSGFKTVTRLGIKNALLTSQSWFLIYRDGSKIRVKYIPWENVYSDPDADDRVDRRWVFHVDILDVYEIEEIYGLSKDSLVAEKDYNNEITNDRKFIPSARESIGNKYADNKARLITCYMIDESTEKVDGELLPLYPFGKIVTFVINQNDGDNFEGIRILEEKANIYEQYPLMDYIPELNDSETEGRPLGRDLSSYQNISDRAAQQSLINYEVCGNSVTFVDDAGLDPNIASKIDLKPGLIIPISGDTQGIKHFPPTPTAQEGMSIAQSMFGFAQNVSGLSDAAAGRKTGRVESAKAYNALATQSQQILQPSMREFEQFLGRLVQVWGEMALDIAVQGYIVRSGEGYKNRLILPFAINAFVHSFEVFIGEDSSMPKDEASQAEMVTGILKQYSGGNFALLETVLKSMGIENVDTIIKDLKDEQGTEQQMQQMQQQMQQLGQQAQKIQGENEKLKGKNDELTLTIKGEILKGKSDIEKQYIKEQGFKTRQQTQIDSKEEMESEKLQFKAIEKLHEERKDDSGKRQE